MGIAHLFLWALRLKATAHPTDVDGKKSLYLCAGKLPLRN